jgi:hypothetical protein
VRSFLPPGEGPAVRSGPGGLSLSGCCRRVRPRSLLCMPVYEEEEPRRPTGPAIVYRPSESPAARSRQAREPKVVHPQSASSSAPRLSRRERVRLRPGFWQRLRLQIRQWRTGSGRGREKATGDAPALPVRERAARGRQASPAVPRGNSVRSGSGQGGGGRSGQGGRSRSSRSRGGRPADKGNSGATSTGAPGRSGGGAGRSSRSGSRRRSGGQRPGAGAGSSTGNGAPAEGRSGPASGRNASGPSAESPSGRPGASSSRRRGSRSRGRGHRSGPGSSAGNRGNARGDGSRPGSSGRSSSGD